MLLGAGLQTLLGAGLLAPPFDWPKVSTRWHRGWLAEPPIRLCGPPAPKGGSGLGWARVSWHRPALAAGRRSP